MIKAPYNFVPLEEKAFYPDWADKISHDIPFEDGVSGCIEYTMRAETPIFVRNGYPNAEYSDRNHPDPTFSHRTRPNGSKEYFIPGTSIKGEIRNVLEILSFGKMTQVQNARFGIREFVDNYGKVIAGVRCGWMHRAKDDNGKAVYRITDCGTPYRIKPEDIDNLFKTRLYDFKVKFTSNNQNVANGDSHESAKDAEEKKRSALYKYDNILGLGLSKRKDCDSAINENLHISFDSEDKNGQKIATHISKGDKNGLNSGTIILTGQPGPRKKDRNGRWTGKYYEFVFPDPKPEAKLDITQEIADDFITIHKNNFDFQNLWDSALHYGYEIPVFFTLKDGKIDAIGLSGMFRIPSANFIKGAIPADLQSENRKDLAECIFGTSNNSLGFLKGRVTFSPAFACGEATEVETHVKTTLSSPKPSYGPLYVKGGTWNDSKAQIKGRKRYPVRNKPWTNGTGNGNTETTFTPLKKDVKFAGKIYFHNLRKCELGAIISALTFDGHNEADGHGEICYHSIGEAKPLGYGKVLTAITGISVVENKDMASSLNAAFSKMNLSNNDDTANPASDKEADSHINNCQPSTNGSGMPVNDCKSSNDDSTESGKSLNEKKDLYLKAFRDIMTGFNRHWGTSDSLKELFAMAKGIPESRDNEFRYMEMSTNRNDNEFSYAKTNGEILPKFSDILKGGSPGKGYKQDWKRKYECDLHSEIQSADEKAITEKAEAEAKDKIKKANECLENNDYGSALEICAYLLNIHDLSLQTKKRIESFHNDALRLKEDTEAKNRLQELKDEANDIFDRAKEAAGDEKVKYLNEFLMKCGRAPELQKDTDILNKIQFCENELKRLKRSTNSIEMEFGTYRIASLKAFAEKLKRWMNDSSTTNLNDSQLTFLGGVIRSGITILNKAGKKDWSDQRRWENIFNGILSPEEIQALFNASNND